MPKAIQDGDATVDGAATAELSCSQETNYGDLDFGDMDEADLIHCVK